MPVVAALPTSDFFAGLGFCGHAEWINEPATVYNETDWPRVCDLARQAGFGWHRSQINAPANPANVAYAQALDAKLKVATDRGLKLTLILGKPGAGPQDWFGTQADLLNKVITTYRDTCIGIEAPNEYDVDWENGGATWPTTLAKWLVAQRDAIRARPQLPAGLPVLGPSLVNWDSPAKLAAAITALGQDPKSICSHVAAHPYRGQDMPTLAGMQQEAQKYAPIRSAPLWPTEHGYTTAPIVGGVNERTQAVYLLRSFLTHRLSGAARSAVYEIADQATDSNGEHRYGILRRDLSPKPAWTALRNLLSILGRNPPPATGPHELELTIVAPGDTRWLLMQKETGTFALAIWREVSVWDPAARVPVTPKPAQVAVFAPAGSSIFTAAPMTSAAVTQVTSGFVQVGGDPIVMLLKP